MKKVIILNFVENPNLPNNRVSTVMISECAGNDVISHLERKKIEVITVPVCGDVALPVSNHPDMLFHHLGGNQIAKYRGADKKVCYRLAKLGFELIESTKVLSPIYPYDIALNAARVGDFLFCKKRHTDKVIIDDNERRGIHIIPVTQGYTKCSVCVVDENSIITADVGIAEAARNNGFDVLIISEGFIKLPGYNSGFIGGCCGKINCNKLAFCGEISNHPDFESIKKFMSDRKIEIETLGNSPLLDIGSIIPLIEDL